HHDWVETFLRHVSNSEHSGEFQLESEQQRGRRLGFPVQLDHNLDVSFGQRRRAHIDLNSRRRLFLPGVERLRRVWVLEREILDVLANYGELRLLLAGSRCRTHLLRTPTCAS